MLLSGCWGGVSKSLAKSSIVPKLLFNDMMLLWGSFDVCIVGEACSIEWKWACWLFSYWLISIYRLPAWFVWWWIEFAWLIAVLFMSSDIFPLLCWVCLIDRARLFPTRGGTNELSARSLESSPVFVIERRDTRCAPVWLKFDSLLPRSPSLGIKWEWFCF